ncbi:MAG: helix-turn-helix domain-containing protein [Chloroflexi bacterium]|jgi:excisionase family DNA binding protein|nr:helix-turn-helix domain-containing protein [Chloroflexota bacterium]
MELRLLKSDEVADILKISRAMAYKLMQRGEIPTIRIGSSVRVRVEDLEKYVEQKTVQSGPYYGEKLRKI